MIDFEFEWKYCVFLNDLLYIDHTTFYSLFCTTSLPCTPGLTLAKQPERTVVVEKKVQGSYNILKISNK